MTYRLIDSGNFKKLEQIGPYKIVRPSAQAVWPPQLPKSKWQEVDAVYESKSNGKGDWKFKTSVDENIQITKGGLSFNLKLTPFGHLGIFAEQADNWTQLQEIIKDSELRILNLFAYTGGSTLACAHAGAKVTHVDASKNTVEWARKNAQLMGLENQVRWIVDDVSKFVVREVKRESQYDGVILDPPSFGRGPKGQVWKIEDDLLPLLENIKKLLSSNFKFILLSCHSTGYSPIALENILKKLFGSKNGSCIKNEMVIKDEQGWPLPSGTSCMFYR